jgi:hypothetical protein
MLMPIDPAAQTDFAAVARPNIGVARLARAGWYGPVH